MSNTSNASKNVKRFLLLFALGIAYGFMYVMPYMKSSFYDQMIAAMGCTNAQLGSLMTAYCICCTVSYLPAAGSEISSTRSRSCWSPSSARRR